MLRMNPATVLLANLKYLLSEIRALLNPPLTPHRDSRTFLTGLSGASMVVTWSRPLDNGGSPITGYILYMKYPDDTMQSYMLNSNITTFTLEGLHRGDVYRFFVIALNKVGKSGNSPMLTAIAAVYPGADASSIPVFASEQFRPTITDVHDTSMTVKWEITTMVKDTL